METTALARIRTFEVSPARFVQLAVANTLLLWLIVGSGAAVRLTDSGLGCRAWPGCEPGRPLPEKDIHAFVEFGNRLVGGVVITLTLVTWLAARRAPGLPASAGRIALLVFVGALAQAPIGYLAVATDLRWPVVMTHLLLSFALLAGAAVVTVEAFGLRDGWSQPVVPPEHVHVLCASKLHGSLASLQASPNRVPLRRGLRSGTPVAAGSRTTAMRAASWVAFSAVFHQKKALATSIVRKNSSRNTGATTTNSTVAAPRSHALRWRIMVGLNRRYSGPGRRR